MPPIDIGHWASASNRQRATLLVFVALLSSKVACQLEDTDDSTFSSSLASVRASLRNGATDLFAAPTPPAPPTPPAAPLPPLAPTSDVGRALESFASRLNGAPNSSAAPLVWQPLPLRATFRPLNRQEVATAANGARVDTRRRGLQGEPVGLISERSISSEAASNSDTGSIVSARAALFHSREQATTTRAPPLLSFEPDDELPTRQPMNRFRPLARDTTPPEPPGSSGANEPTSSSSHFGASPILTNFSSQAGPTNSLLLSNECLECICEASTNCNANSKCQTSDVRHTRCGMFLISYDQWLSTNLSGELVSREALARDAAADERAFYECVTKRDCAQRLLNIYMQRHQKDCNSDGLIDCYDLAAVHYSGMEQCASETLLDSQYWSDFNACFGFSR